MKDQLKLLEESKADMQHKFQQKVHELLLLPIIMLVLIQCLICKCVQYYSIQCTFTCIVAVVSID